SDHAPFISTASSHDLMTHHRVNTTFDPAMGCSAGAPGLVKDYQNGLDRRLQEENEVLMDRLRRLE
ncbi:hypothetical protein L208DRAFT_1214000, partial [Tricholoma matsutake]